ncbi:MAG: hypothetical protein KC713_08230 [Candidatus Omnitrophica bacterium]|nr:hypothetical protein [Candidatus Omnitrophota bacterium]
MDKRHYINLGPLLSLPMKKGTKVKAFGHNYTIFRETYGHCFVLDNETERLIGEKFDEGVLDGHTLKFKDGTYLDLQTGKFEKPDKKEGLKIKITNSWIENGFILVSLMDTLSSTGLF